MSTDSFIVRLRNSAQRDLEKLPEALRDRILTQLDHLEENPRPRGAIKIEGGKHGYRLRIGDYRALYIVDFDGKTVWVFRIAHRREVYR